MRAEAEAGLRHEEATVDDLDAVNRRIDDLEKRFTEAFPAGDHVGHSRYHALMIEDIDSRKRLRQAVMEKTISGIVWAVVVAGGLALWAWIKAQVKGG